MNERRNSHGVNHLSIVHSVVHGLFVAAVLGALTVVVGLAWAVQKLLDWYDPIR